MMKRSLDYLTPKALNVNNPVQAVGVARGRENRRQNPPPNLRQRGIWNSVGVQHLPASCCAPTEHRVSTLHRSTPSCIRLTADLHGVIHIARLRRVDQNLNKNVL